VPKAFPIPMVLGMCVPEVCTVSDFNNFKSYLVTAINAMIPQLFQGIKGFNLNIQLNTDDMHFEDANQKNKDATKADAWSWIIVLLIIFFLLSMIISSIAFWYFKKESERR
jgi:Ca2+/H+ antiporter